MSGSIPINYDKAIDVGTNRPGQENKALKNSKIVRILLTSIALLFFTVMLLVPLISVFVKAFEQGTKVYLAAISDPIALSAIKLTLLTIAIVVPINTVFGVIAAWAVAKFKFKGKNLLITVIDLPLPFHR